MFKKSPSPIFIVQSPPTLKLGPEPFPRVTLREFGPFTSRGRERLGKWRGPTRRMWWPPTLLASLRGNRWLAASRHVPADKAAYKIPPFKNPFGSTSSWSLRNLRVFEVLEQKGLHLSLIFTWFWETLLFEQLIRVGVQKNFNWDMG